MKFVKDLGFVVVCAIAVNDAMQDQIRVGALRLFNNLIEAG